MMNSLRRISLAPMMDCTDRHYRFFVRLLSRHIYLYTEMVTSKAIIYGDRDFILGKDASEGSIALQIAGNDPGELAQCVIPIEDYGYDEINLNVGCPSDRVSAGSFGACLIKEPELVAECIDALKKKSALPITVKTRIGVDDKDSYEDLYYFVTLLQQAGLDSLIMHARKGWLKGLSPKENREVPPLRYDVVQKLQGDFPNLEIILNGGIHNWKEAQEHLGTFKGVMLGREPYRNPYMLATVDQQFYGSEEPCKTREEVLEKFIPYLEQGVKRGWRLHWMVRHITGLYLGMKGAKTFRTVLGEEARHHGADESIIRKAMQFV